MDMTPYLTTIYRGLKHFRNLRSERSPAKYVAKADAEVSSWFLWMSSMLRVYPSSKTLATRSGWLDQLRLTVDNLASHQVKHSDSLWSPGCSLIFVYMFLWCSFCSIIVKRRNSYAYESPAQRNHFSFFSCQESMVKVAQWSVLDFELTSLLGGPGILDRWLWSRLDEPSQQDKTPTTMRE